MEETLAERSCRNSLWEAIETLMVLLAIKPWNLRLNLLLNRVHLMLLLEGLKNGSGNIRTKLVKSRNQALRHWGWLSRGLC